jgi:phage terminase large subunit GpA-like protein
VVKGFTQYEWHKPDNAHDEAGDCTRMAYAALLLVARRYAQGRMWDQLEAQLPRAAAEASQSQAVVNGQISLAGWKA